MTQFQSISNLGPVLCGLRRALTVASLACVTLPAAAQSQLWFQQLGTTTWDAANDLAPDGVGGVYAGGITLANLGGINQGLHDVWIARYDIAGNQLWILQFGDTSFDLVDALAADGAGGLYVSGSTTSSLGGQTAGDADAWLARYDNLGNQLWIRQLGTSGYDVARGLSSDGSGGVYVAGGTAGNLGGSQFGLNDAWLARYDGAGNQAWIRQFGSSASDSAYAAALDGSGGAFVSGWTNGDLAGPNAGLLDAWITRFDSSGNQLWSRQLGSNGEEIANTLIPDGAGGILVGGSTTENLGGAHYGNYDAWLARYDSSGVQTWIKQYGTELNDVLGGGALDGAGGLYLSGSSDGSFGGANLGGNDAWLARCDSLGNPFWVKNYGSNSDDLSHGVATDAAGGAYLGGGSKANPFGSSDPQNAWIAHIDGSCTSGSVYCSSLVSSSGCVPRMLASGAPQLSKPADFSVAGVQLEADKNGLVFFGAAGPANTAFFGGTLCVNPPLYRLPVKNSAGIGACSGSVSYTLVDYLAHPSGGSFVFVGKQLHSQAWFRDPQAAQTVGLSNGYEFTTCP